LFLQDSLNQCKLFLDADCLVTFLCRDFSEILSPNILPPAEGSLSPKYFRAQTVFGGSLGVCFFSVITLSSSVTGDLAGWCSVWHSVAILRWKTEAQIFVKQRARS